MATYTVGISDAKNNFSKITAEINRLGKPVTVLKNNKPWVIIMPANAAQESSKDVAVDLIERTEYTFINFDEE